MIVNYLILVLGLLAVTQPTAARRKVAGVFTAIVLLHCIAGEWMGGGEYYISAAILASAIINITVDFKGASSITRSIHRICLASIVLNMAGWVVYKRYMPPTVYNSSFIFLYLWAIMVLMGRDRRYAGDDKLDTWAYYFRLSSYT